MPSWMEEELANAAWPPERTVKGQWVSQETLIAVAMDCADSASSRHAGVMAACCADQ